MAVNSIYGPGLYPVACDSEIKVEFQRADVSDTGDIGGVQYFNHATLGWENEFDSTKHRKVISRVADGSVAKGFPVPFKVSDDPTAFAVVSAIADDGRTLAVIEMAPSCQLFMITRGARAY